MEKGSGKTGKEGGEQEWVLFHRGCLQFLDTSMVPQVGCSVSGTSEAEASGAVKCTAVCKTTSENTLIQAQLTVVMFREENKNNKAKVHYKVYEKHTKL